MRPICHGRIGPALSSSAIAAFMLVTIGVAEAALPAGNAVQQWNRIAEDTVVASGAFQNEGIVYMAYVSAAVYDAAVAVERRFAPYGPSIEAPAGALLDAAV